MAQTMVNFRMDADLKRRMDETCRKMGMSMSTALNMFATKVVQEQRIPFEITADPFFSEANMNRLAAIARGIDNGTIQLSEHELIED